MDDVIAPPYTLAHGLFFSTPEAMDRDLLLRDGDAYAGSLNAPHRRSDEEAFYQAIHLAGGLHLHHVAGALDDLDAD